MARPVNGSDGVEKSEEVASVPHLERTAGEPRDEVSSAFWSCFFLSDLFMCCASCLV